MGIADTEMNSYRRRAALLAAMGLLLIAAGCFGRRPAEVSPAEIPALEERLAENPDNADAVLRYAAALFAAERCDTARVVALRGMTLRPARAVGPLILGQCLERAREWDQALAAYRQFLAAHPEARGAPAVAARERIVLRARAAERARLALAQEQELAQQAGDPRTLAVLPLDIAGDSTYQPLSRGLAQIITSDLDLLQQFRLVERLQVNALVQEMQLVETGRVDVATAARVGRLLQAGQMVQGLAAIPDEEDVRLEVTVVQSDGRVTSPAMESGRLRDLLRMEKAIVVAIAGQLGYVLSEAERRLILENGTQNLAAFLAYSRGLIAEDLGDYSAAAAFFGEAVRRDPRFRQARQDFQAASVAQRVQEAAPTEVVAVAEEAPAEPAASTETVAGAAASAVADVASTAGESQTSATENTATTTTAPGTTGGGTNTADPSSTTTTIVTTQNVTGTIKIRFRLP